MDWRWWRKKTPGRTLRVRSRSDSPAVARIDLSDLTPTAADFLAGACATHLILAGEIGRVAREAWSATDTDALVRAEQIVTSRYVTLRGLLGQYVPDMGTALSGPLETQRQSVRRLKAERWYERVTTCLVVDGFLMDFYQTIASGLPEPLSAQLAPLFTEPEEQELLHEVLQRVLLLDDGYVSRVSLWARRLVGDTMLIARSVLPERKWGNDGDRLEPVFTDVIAHHTRRLDRLGLTA